MSTRSRIATICIASTLVATGCGSSDGVPSPDAGPAKYYSTEFRQNQLIALMSFGGGLSYGFYQEDFSQPTAPEFVYAGFFKATASPPWAGSPPTGHDHRFRTRETVAISLVDISATEQALSFVLRSDKGSDTVHGVRASVDELPTTPSLLAGAYVVQARSTLDSQKGTASISSSGDLQVDLPGGCSITGSLSARPQGNLYDAAADFSSVCAIASGAFTGHAIQNQAARFTYILLTAAPDRGVLLFLLPTSIALAGD